MGVRIGKIYVWLVCNRSSEYFFVYEENHSGNNEKKKKFSRLTYCADRDFAV